MRAVVIAVIIGFFAGSAMAADRYVEVWNPPEASGHKPPVASKKAARGAHSPSTRKAAKSAAKKPPKSAATSASRRNHASTKSARTVGVKPKSAAPGRAQPPILG